MRLLEPYAADYGVGGELAGVLQLVEVHVERQLVHARDLEILVRVVEPGLAVIEAHEAHGVVLFREAVSALHNLRDEVLRAAGGSLPVREDGEEESQYCEERGRCAPHFS